jgi:hypothetical protein
MAAGAPDSGQVGTLVRSWLHYDNLASSLYRQANKARQLRDEYEERIITYLRQAGMENAVIQINGGHMNVVEEKNPKALSLTRIEELLHGYFLKKGGRDETNEIMSYIRGHRGVDICKKLRKSGMGQPALPALPRPGTG